MLLFVFYRSYSRSLNEACFLPLFWYKQLVYKDLDYLNFVIKTGFLNRNLFFFIYLGMLKYYIFSISATKTRKMPLLFNEMPLFPCERSDFACEWSV